MYQVHVLSVARWRGSDHSPTVAVYPANSAVEYTEIRVGVQETCAYIHSVSNSELFPALLW